LCAELVRYNVSFEKFERREATLKPKRPEALKTRYASASIKSALRRMFGTKCCYCEAKVEAVSHRHVEHFRPQSLYPALAYRWNNLLFACERCNSTHKRDRFPLAPTGTQPMPDPEKPCSLDDSDDGLLIDPCTDYPSDHFDYDFLENGAGEVVDVTLVCKTRRALETRDVCGLNRHDLVDDMREHLRYIKFGVEALLHAQITEDRSLERKARKYLTDAASPSNQCSAMVKAYVKTKLE